MREINKPWPDSKQLRKRLEYINMLNFMSCLRWILLRMNGNISPKWLKKPITSPKSNQFWRCANYRSMPNAMPFLPCIILGIRANLKLNLFNQGLWVLHLTNNLEVTRFFIPQIVVSVYFILSETSLIYFLRSVMDRQMARRTDRDWVFI